jgi:hypothetical protein
MPAYLLRARAYFPLAEGTGAVPARAWMAEGGIRTARAVVSPFGAQAGRKALAGSGSGQTREARRVGVLHASGADLGVVRGDGSDACDQLADERQQEARLGADRGGIRAELGPLQVLPDPPAGRRRPVQGNAAGP